MASTYTQARATSVWNVVGFLRARLMALECSGENDTAGSHMQGRNLWAGLLSISFLTADEVPVRAQNLMLCKLQINESCFLFNHHC